MHFVKFCIVIFYVFMYTQQWPTNADITLGDCGNYCALSAGATFGKTNDNVNDWDKADENRNMLSVFSESAQIYARYLRKFANGVKSMVLQVVENCGSETVDGASCFDTPTGNDQCLDFYAVQVICGDSSDSPFGVYIYEAWWGNPDPKAPNSQRINLLTLNYGFGLGFHPQWFDNANPPARYGFYPCGNSFGLGDPAPGVLKRLHLHFACVDKQHNNVISLVPTIRLLGERAALDFWMQCPDPTTALYVQRATWNNDLNCDGSSQYSTIFKNGLLNIQDENSSPAPSMTADSNTMMGSSYSTDPCPGYVKYLNMDIGCFDDITYFGDGGLTTACSCTCRLPNENQANSYFTNPAGDDGNGATGTVAFNNSQTLSIKVDDSYYRDRCDNGFDSDKVNSWSMLGKRYYAPPSYRNIPGENRYLYPPECDMLPAGCNHDACNNRGLFVYGENLRSDGFNSYCNCNSSYFGRNCQYSCRDLACNGHGDCTLSYMECSPECGIEPALCKCAGRNFCPNYVSELNKFLTFTPPFTYNYDQGLNNCARTGGTCTCDSGWIGNACNQRCGDVYCNGRGDCVSATNTACNCTSAYAGAHCEITCGEKYCNNRGSCSVQSNGSPTVCTCQSGFRGDQCQIVNNDQFCNSHGVYDENMGSCECEMGYFGLDCSLQISQSDLFQCTRQANSEQTIQFGAKNINTG